MRRITVWLEPLEFVFFFVNSDYLLSIFDILADDQTNRNQFEWLNNSNALVKCYNSMIDSYADRISIAFLHFKSYHITSLNGPIYRKSIPLVGQPVPTRIIHLNACDLISVAIATEWAGNRTHCLGVYHDGVVPRVSYAMDVWHTLYLIRSVDSVTFVVAKLKKSDYENWHTQTDGLWHIFARAFVNWHCSNIYVNNPKLIYISFEPNVNNLRSAYINIWTTNKRERERERNRVIKMCKNYEWNITHWNRWVWRSKRRKKSNHRKLIIMI